MRDQSIIVLPHVYFHLFFFVKVSTSFKLNRSNWRNRVTNEYTRASHKCQPECQTCRAVWRAQSLRQSPSRPLLYPYAIHSRGYHRIRHGSRSLRDFRVFLDFSDRPGSCTPARPNGNYSLTFLSPICRKAVSYSLLILGAATFGVAVTYPEQVVWAYTAASRASRIICMSILVAIDYKWSLRKSLLVRKLLDRDSGRIKEPDLVSRTGGLEECRRDRWSRQGG
ncbi:hypothetical protein BC830DRAFT_776457 [Chytriomyces sp. MP71]|nr:hypothetical protein BC830DRAFT_776457 [Chytriomyces sp. MP71]